MFEVEVVDFDNSKKNLEGVQKELFYFGDVKWDLKGGRGRV